MLNRLQNVGTFAKRFIRFKEESTVNYPIKRFRKMHAYNMGGGDESGPSLNYIIDKLEEFAPANTAEDWDNTGLLIDPMDDAPIKTILMANDLTEAVLEEALENDVKMIISYHPPIFKPLKSVTSKTWKERIVVTCIKNGIAVYSPHTSWDVTYGGVNDWLAMAFKVKTSEKISEAGAGRLCQLENPVTLRDAIQNIKKHLSIQHLRVALAKGKNLDNLVRKVALCAGAGTSVLAGVKADLYLTGEMLHHDVLEAIHNGAHVVLVNHATSERGFLKYFALALQDNMLKGSVRVLISEKDYDPLKTM